MIDCDLVKQLIASQFPHLRGLPVRAVENSGWDNRSFHLGDSFLVRMPSAAPYAAQIAKEQTWLPKLASRLPFDIPEPVAMGAPEAGYPFAWSVYRWIDGRDEAEAPVSDLPRLAADLADFLRALWAIDPTGGPPAGDENFHRGGSLSIYDAQVREAAQLLSEAYPAAAIQELWDTALTADWSNPAVWVHGDIAPGNLIVRDGRLRAVIDFGQIAVGDPACDLAIAWRRFDQSSRETFRRALDIDDATWERGKAWALWKALVVRAGLVHTNTAEEAAAAQTLKAILHES
ncbi:MAG: aminoglycoside phosphotransferase family protein [Maricaulaceae bacterium]